MDLEQSGFNRSGSAQSPQQTGQPQDKFALDGSRGVELGRDGQLEGLVVVRIFQVRDHGFRGQAVAYGVTARPTFSGFGPRPGALERIAAVGLELFKRRHGEPVGYRIWPYGSNCGPRLRGHAPGLAHGPG